MSHRSDASYEADGQCQGMVGENRKAGGTTQVAALSQLIACYAAQLVVISRSLWSIFPSGHIEIALLDL